MMNRRDKWRMWRPPGASRKKDSVSSSSDSSSSSSSSSSDTSEDDEMTIDVVSKDLIPHGQDLFEDAQEPWLQNLLAKGNHSYDEEIRIINKIN